MLSLRGLVTATVGAIATGVLLVWVFVMAFLRSETFSLQQWTLVALIVGLHSFFLTVLVGRSPWNDIARGFGKMFRSDNE